MAKILIVEDEKAQINIISTELEKSGYEVIQAHNGQEGLGLMEKETPDLVLMDIIMPIMDGITALKKMRENEKIKDIPVIILTNLSDASKKNEAIQYNSADFLVKSDWKLEDIIAKVKETLHE